ncbi:aminotransferase-like domain-containing protein [Burkholderia cepacia]|uniref:aminotransferase-like domain-containing protein n=1 Tax=Burkholderia cepacia TaxID=292 RepID=UPI000F5AE5EA|nr:PLP-dependent aminotransferase family protein [Burkholderia cepacia]RQU01617.1 PLP-dependent aminotransferase family protein [Burkholderia cepacia]
MRENSDGYQPLYVKLAKRIEYAIQVGAYAPGDRLPSLRKCAQDHSVSLSTVLEAYRSLEDARLIECRPKAGHFVAVSMQLASATETSELPSWSAAIEVATLIETMMRSTSVPDLVSFGSGYPSCDLMQAEMKRAVLHAVQRSGSTPGYDPTTPGEDALRKAIARRTLTMGCTLDPREIILTTGTTESVSLCLMAVTKPGDTVAVESPTSFGFLRTLGVLGLSALEIPSHPVHGLSVDALALALRTNRVSAVLATPTLSNPMGTCMPLAERERLVQLLARYGVPLIEDVIYNDLVKDDVYRRAVKSYDKGEVVLLCGSYSKTISPGLRVGWLYAGAFSARIRTLKSAISGGNCLINELALAELLTESGYNRRLRALHQAYRASFIEARRIIAHSFPKGTRVNDPIGGSILWIELPDELDSLALFEACLQEQILIAPGTMFSVSDSYKHCFRISVPRLWENEHSRALTRIGEITISLSPSRQ